MEQIIDGLKRIITRWVKAVTPLTADVQPGDTTVKVVTTRRFKVNEEIMLRDGSGFEKPNNFRVAEVIDNTTLRLNQPVVSPWSPSFNAVVVKTVQGQPVEAIYPYDPENITMFPAITILGVSDDREWLTIDSVKHYYNVSIGVYFSNSGMEKNYRGVLQLTKLVSNALSNNLFPLVNDYETTVTTADVITGDLYIKVNDPSIFCVGGIVLIEDPWKTMENRVAGVDAANGILHLQGPVTSDFKLADGVTVIKPNRFIYNSYPKSIKFDTIHRGGMLTGATVMWFGEEEEVDPIDGGGWSDPSLQ